jgi:TonB-dependent SusC/RagA subfamily outer membrane receptor
MKTILLLIFCSYSLWAQRPVFAQAKLQSATVYFSGAELHHKTSVTLPEGTTEMVISNVANELDESSLRISAPKSVTVLATQYTQQYATEFDPEFERPELAKVHDSIRFFQSKLQSIIIQKGAVEKTIALLNANTKLSGNNTGILTQQLANYSLYYQSKLYELSWEAFVLGEKQVKYQKQLDFWHQQLTPKPNSAVKSKGQLVLYLNTTQAGTHSIQISYTTTLAGWEPTYDLKATSLTQPLALVMKSQLWQTTGIDWNNVKLTLSNGNPTTQHEAPLQQAWTLVYRNPYGKKEKITMQPNANLTQTLQGQLAGVNITGATGNPGAKSSVIIRGVGTINANTEPLYIIDGKPTSAADFRNLPPNAVKNVEVLKDANAVAIYGNRGSNGVIVVTTKQNVSDYTEVVERELNVSFDIDLPYVIVSNGKKHGIEIKNLEIPANFQYYSVPKMKRDVFLMAEITDFGQYNLLPGKAQLYFEDTGVGTTQLNPNETQDTLRVCLGRDKKITILREKVKAKSATKFLSSQKEQHFTYEITLRNNKKEAVTLDLRDQYPLSNDSSISIELTDDGKATVNSDKGFLRWNISLQPNETKKVRFSYTVRSDKHKMLEKL